MEELIYRSPYLPFIYNPFFFGPKPWIGLPRSQVLGEKASLLPVGHTQRMPSSISQLVHLKHLLTNPKTAFSYQWNAKLMTGNESRHAIKGVYISELPNQPSDMEQVEPPDNIS